MSFLTDSSFLSSIVGSQLQTQQQSPHSLPHSMPHSLPHSMPQSLPPSQQPPQESLQPSQPQPQQQQQSPPPPPPPQPQQSPPPPPPQLQSPQQQEQQEQQEQEQQEQEQQEQEQQEQEQEQEQSRVVELKYPDPIVLIQGINDRIFSDYVNDPETTALLSNMQGTRKFSQSTIEVLQSCATTGHYYWRECIPNLRRSITEEDFHAHKKLIGAFIKPYVLTAFNFLLNRSGNQRNHVRASNGNRQLSAFEAFDTTLQEYYVGSDFFDVVRLEGASIRVLYDSIPAQRKTGRSQITYLRNKIKEQESCPFTFEHAAYFLMKCEVEGSLLNACFVKNYKKYVSSIADKAVKRLERDLYPKRDAESEEEEGDGGEGEVREERGDEDIGEADDDSQDGRTEDTDDAIQALIPSPTRELSPTHYDPDARSVGRATTNRDDNWICLAAGIVSTRVALDEVIREGESCQQSDNVIAVHFENDSEHPQQSLIAVNCSHPLQLIFQESLFDRFSFDPVHITCIVGIMPLYLEVVIMIRCGRFKRLRSVSFLKPHDLESTFETEMKRLLSWSNVKTFDMTYGDSPESYSVVTFFNSDEQPEENLAIDTDMDATRYNQVTTRNHRHRLFSGIQTTASHPMEARFRLQLLRSINLSKGDSCLEIGCGVPFLSLDMAAFSEAPVMLLDIEDVYKPLRQVLDVLLQRGICSLLQTNRTSRQADHRSCSSSLNASICRRRVINDDSDDDKNSPSKKRCMSSASPCQDRDESTQSDSMLRIYMNNPSGPTNVIHVDADGDMSQLYKLVDSRIYSNKNVRFTCTSEKHSNKQQLPLDPTTKISETALNNECTVSMEVLGPGGSRRRIIMDEDFGEHVQKCARPTSSKSNMVFDDNYDDSDEDWDNDGASQNNTLLNARNAYNQRRQIVANAESAYLGSSVVPSTLVRCDQKVKFTSLHGADVLKAQPAVGTWQEMKQLPKLAQVKKLERSLQQQQQQQQQRQLAAKQHLEQVRKRKRLEQQGSEEQRQKPQHRKCASATGVVLLAAKTKQLDERRPAQNEKSVAIKSARAEMTEWQRRKTLLVAVKKKEPPNPQYSLEARRQSHKDERARRTDRDPAATQEAAIISETALNDESNVSVEVLGPGGSRQNDDFDEHVQKCARPTSSKSNMVFDDNYDDSDEDWDNDGASQNNTLLNARNAYNQRRQIVANAESAYLGSSVVPSTLVRCDNDFLTFPISPLRGPPKRYILVELRDRKITFPLNELLVTSTWKVHDANESSNQSTFCELDSIGEVPSTISLHEGFLLIARIWSSPSSIEFYLVGIASKEGIVIYKKRREELGQRLENNLKKHVSRYGLEKKVDLDLHGRQFQYSAQLNYERHLCYIQADQWNHRCGLVSEVNHRRTSALVQIKKEVKLRSQLNVLLHPLPRTDEDKANKRRRKCHIALHCEANHNSASEIVQGRQNEYKVAKTEGIFAAKLSLPDIIRATRTVLSKRDYMDEGAKEMVHGALGLALFYNLHWRMDDFPQVPSTDFRIKNVTYDVDQICIDLRKLKLKSNCIERSEYLETAVDDLKRVVLAGSDCRVTSVLGNEGKAGGHTYMTKEQRKRYVPFTRDNSCVFLLSVGIANKSLNEVKDAVANASTLAAEHLSPNFYRTVPFQDSQEGRKKAVTFSGGKLHSMLTLAILLFDNREGVDLVVETYNNKLHGREKRNSLGSKGVAQKILVDDGTREPFLFQNIINYFGGTGTEQRLKFQFQSVKLILGTGCEVTANDTNGNTLLTHVSHVPYPCATELKNPANFFYPTQKKVPNSDEFVQRCILLKNEKNWTPYSVYGLSLPLHLQPATVRGTVLNEWAGTKSFGTTLYRIQSYYPSAKFAAGNFAKHHARDSFMVTTNGTRVLNAPSVQVKFTHFQEHVEKHLKNLSDPQYDGLYQRVELATIFEMKMGQEQFDMAAVLQKSFNDLDTIVEDGLRAYNFNDYAEYQTLYLKALALCLKLNEKYCNSTDSYDRYVDIIPSILEINKIMDLYYSGRRLLGNFTIKGSRLSVCTGRPVLHPCCDALTEALATILSCEVTRSNLATDLFQELGIQSSTFIWPQYAPVQAMYTDANQKPSCCTTCFRIFSEQRCLFTHHQCIVPDTSRINKESWCPKPLNEVPLFLQNLRNALTLINQDHAQKRFYTVATQQPKLNMFLTGRAGAGKTFALSTLLDYMHWFHGEGAIAVLANTCLVAEGIGGETIHSFFGLDYYAKLEELTVDSWVQSTINGHRFHGNKQNARARFLKYRKVVIDEVSHISAGVLDKLSEVFSILVDKLNDGPFGGRQVFLCGDVLQLPPPNNGDLPFYRAEAYWKSNSFNVIYLGSNHRSSESEFTSLLNKVRIGDVTAEDVNDINQNWGKNVCPKDVILAFAVSVGVSTMETGVRDLQAAFKNFEANKQFIAWRNHLQTWKNRNEIKSSMYKSRYMELIDERCPSLVQNLLERLNKLHPSSDTSCCRCFDESFRNFSLKSTSNEQFYDQLISLYKSAKANCSCNQGTAPLILVTTKKEAHVAAQVLLETSERHQIAEAIDIVYEECSPTARNQVIDPNIIRNVKDKIHLMGSMQLPERILIAEGTPAVVVKSHKKEGLLNNALGTIHASPDPYKVIFSRYPRKSSVCTFDAAKNLMCLINEPHKIEVQREQAEATVTLDGTRYILQRTQFPLKSTLGVHSYVVQGQELNRPLIVSLARNSQDKTLGINSGNAYCLISRATCSANVFLVHDAVVEDFQVSSNCAKFDFHHRSALQSPVNYEFDVSGNIIQMAAAQLPVTILGDEAQLADESEDESDVD